MNILQISSVPIDFPGGTEKVITELSTRLSNKHSVTILQTNLYVPDKKESEEIRRNIKIITCKNDLWLGGFGYSSSFKRKLKEIWNQFDVVHIHGHGRFTSDYSLHFLKSKLPIVYSGQGFFHRKNFIKKFHDLLLGRLLKNANICTALTELESTHLTERFKIKKENIKILPGGIDYSFFKKIKNSDLKNFRKLHDIKKSEKHILYVGRIHKSKGLQYVIKAIAGTEINLLIVGKETGYKQELEKISKQFNMDKKVRFLGVLNKDELLQAYHVSDSFVLFSEWEGFGIVVLEAFATKTPVIVSDRGALPFLAKNGKNCFVVPWKNLEELKRKISDSLNNKKTKKMIKRSLTFAKNYTWDNLTTMLENIYYDTKN